MKTKNVYINTIGCQMNVYDSGQMAKVLKHKNYKSVDSFSNADLIIVNTCAIREKAVQKVYSFLGRLSALKKKNTGLKVVVAGCVAQQQGAKLIKRFPQVDIVLGTHAINQLPDLLQKIEEFPQSIVENEFSEIIHETVPSGIAMTQKREVTGFVTIMRGCDNYCTYCVVPYVRGREISRKPESIINEIQMLVQSGVNEITLLGQNVNSYGVKEGLTTFPELLAMVNDIDGLERIRFVTSHPKDLSDQLIESFGGLNKVCNHIHLPVQSGSNHILKKMNRKYTREAYLEKIEKLRAVSSEIAITTDFIVGFPGETEQDFNATIGLMETVQFDSVFAFEYSDRPEAPATRFSDKINLEVKHHRLQCLFKLQKEITRKMHHSLIGQAFSVLIEGASKNQLKKISTSAMVELSGRTSENRIVNFDGSPDWGIDIDSLKGQTVNVEIVKAFSNSLWGVLSEHLIEYLKSEGGHSHVA
ncbi:MAG: tRNA (N6-isopentenyl adenosine(37)-C2)-methylthiotransferase MiaB [Desulfobacteraceae bacterium]|nr:tRNA (N6-isopentenyl adenosine(37)-C2)-methylthiotransferase MiaB [Desulfobacteraceae bacterium]MBC2756918.1 tRNA (N6-isopentenyl adenosine(37)-C2)-methylthiotransferase MiaB [Desulfobacteraceae bacterium]